jgi:predicted RNA-binding Zn ribbon-like protein
MAMDLAGLSGLEFPTDDPVKLANYWSAEINAANKWFEKFVTRSKRVEDRYLDDRTDNTSGVSDSASVLNLFWSNVEVMIAALYARPPKVDVSRTFKDPDDDVARVAANILERVIQNDIQNESESDGGTFRDAILDRLVVGLGQLWARYEVETAKQTQPATTDPMTGMEIAPAREIEVIVDEKSPLDFVRWEDFLCSPIRRWRDCRWAARRVYMTKPQVMARFGEKIAESITFDKRTVSSLKSEENPLLISVVEQAQIYEIWDKQTKKAYWWSKDAPTILDFKDVPIKFPGFFPCPPPLLASTTTKSILPRCEYYMAQDQYEELDLVTSRIHLLTEAIRVVGVYDKNNEGVKNILSTKTMNEMIPVNNWAMFAEKGGLKGAVDWFPLDMVISTMDKLTGRKAEIIQEIYQVLGISDIMRGMSNPNETLGAQQLKSQFGGARIGRTQATIAFFVQSGLQLKATIITSLYQPQQLMKKSQIMSSLDAKYAEQAIQLLKDPSMPFRIKVQADSMASPEWLSEKQERTGVVQSIAQFIGMSMPLIQSFPASGPYMIKILQWAVAGYKGGEELETVLDDAFTAMQQPKPPAQPSPMQIAELQKTQAEVTSKQSSAAKTAAETRHQVAETAFLPLDKSIEIAEVKQGAAPIHQN